MSSCTDDGAVYSSQHLKKKLLEHYQSHLYFAEVCGRKNVLCFQDMCSFIINDTWYKEKKAETAEDESVRIVRAAARLIAAEMQALPYNMDTYPTGADISSDDANRLPPLLQTFVAFIIHSEIKQTAIGQLIVQAARPRSLLLPIPFGLAVEMDHVFGSKFLVTELARLGFCISYDEVVRFKQSVVSSVSPGDVSSETVCAKFTQWVADNVDHNVRTLDGYNTFHGMGIISASVFDRSQPVPVEKTVVRLRHRLAAGEMAMDRGVKIVPYACEAKSGLSDFEMAELLHLQRPLVLPAACNLNLVWHAAYFRQDCDTPARRPNWSGYMQNTCVGEHNSAALITMLPIIDLNPSDESCIYSTLLFVVSQAAKLNVTVPCITFDQPLWLKAVEIVRASGLDIVVRLGGFHLLMSFMGAIGSVMAGSGLEEAFQLNYGPDTVLHMLSGKAVSRAVRCHFLVDSALTVLLLERILNPTSQSVNVAQAIGLDAPVGGIDMVAASSASTLTSADLASIMSLCDAVYEQKLAAEDSSILQCAGLQQLESQLRRLKQALARMSRTAKLWLQYMRYVDKIKLFLIAERTGNWHLHLAAVSDMLNLFAAAGHNNYAKCGRLYLQLMTNLSDEKTKWLYDMFVDNGLHSIRRSDRYWAGLSSDLVIEQTMMKSLKSRGGLTRGRGMDEGVRSMWVHTMHQCAAIHLAMTSKTGVHSVAEHHVDVGESRMTRDSCDLQKVVVWLKLHSPFAASDDKLRSISSGVTASDEDHVTCDSAEDVGATIQRKITGMTFYNIVLKKVDQIRSLATLSKPCVVGTKLLNIDSNNLFHRLVVVIERSGSIEPYFSFELTPTPSSIFKDGMMRKADKPVLAKQLCTGVPPMAMPSNVFYVVDGGCLLHRVRWTKNTAASDVVQQYVDYVGRRFGVGTVVVFDGYGVEPSTKDHEHKRRSLKVLKVSADIVLEHSTQIIFDQHSFLSNETNKNRFISMLISRLNSSGFVAVQGQGDADTEIVSHALQCARSLHQPVAVFADDTDILVMLVYHYNQEMQNIYFVSDAKAKASSGKHINIANVQRNLLPRTCSQLLVIHAVGGCDTVSGIFGHGKGTVMRKITASRITQPITATLLDKSATVSDVETAGLKLMVLLYGGKPGDSLNKMRFEAYSRMAAVSAHRPQPERLPPTEHSAALHMRRAHLQAVVWHTLKNDELDPLQWGWKLSNGKLEPIMTDQPIAPDDLLKVICCNCKSGCTSAKCTCRKNGLSCVPACGSCHGENCANSEPTLGCNDDCESESDADDADEMIGLAEDEVGDLCDFLYDTDLDWLTEEMVEDDGGQ